MNIWSLVQPFRTGKFAGKFGEVSIRSWVIVLDGKHKLMLINDQKKYDCKCFPHRPIEIMKPC